MAQGEQRAEVISAWPEREAPTTGLAAEPTSPDAVHLLRTTQQIQYQLSQMADQKASMLLGITFVIFTLTLGQARMGGGGAPPLPLLILGGAAFVAATLSVFAVMPLVGGPGASGRPNLLFFGVFSRMSEREFIDALMARLGDTSAVHETFAHDIYQNGRVLAAKKYRFLIYAYAVLLVGLVSSLIAFVAPFVAHWFRL